MERLRIIILALFVVVFQEFKCICMDVFFGRAPRVINFTQGRATSASAVIVRPIPAMPPELIPAMPPETADKLNDSQNDCCHCQRGHNNNP